MNFFGLKRIMAIFALLITLGYANAVQAGFGISPPYINNSQLTPGSRYEQQIMLLRSSAEDELKAEVKINAPEIASWITIDKGTEFPLPKGQVQVPMLVTINVPKNAELGNYKGSINVRISSGANTKNGVAIALGARIDVDLSLTNVANADFIVRVASIQNIEMLKWPWSLPIFNFFLHRVPVVMNIENIGNVKTGPSKISLEVFDLTRNRVLESKVNTDIDEVDPFSSKEIKAYFRTKLGLGQYWGRIKIYKDETIVNSYEIAFTIGKPGEFGQKMGIYPWILAGIYLALIIILLTILIYFRSWRLAGRTIWSLIILLSLPFRPVARKTSTGWADLKANFWRWIGDKVSQHNDQDKPPRRK
jgi:hypothetical protein